MSTRRARIKAVAALPPRRKNADADAKTKQNGVKEGFEKGPKQNGVKEGFEKGPKSPRTPRTPKKDNERSPSVASQKSVRTPPDLIPITTSKTPTSAEKVFSPKPPTITEAIRIETPPELRNNKFCSPRAEKVSVITSSPSITNVFASPTPRNTSEKRFAPSPRLLLSPRVRNGEVGQKTKSVDTKVDKNAISKETNKDTNSIVQEEHRKAAQDEMSKDRNQNRAVSTPTMHEKYNGNGFPDDYSIHSVPESITNEAVIDGIIPLPRAKNIPKPIELLKKELISEYAEVSFDPIVPLPSPSKIRPKLRPVPRLGPHRRNSVQGSASESEDESRRLLSGGPHTPVSRQRHDSHTSLSTLLSAPIREPPNRIRNDSISSITTQHPTASSPVKEKQSTKAKRHEMTKRMMQRRRENSKPEVLTMYDLIFFNPTSNPIVPDQDEVKAKEANKKEEQERNSKMEEEKEDDPPTCDAAPVPQIKLGPNGEIILDEQSLVIKSSDKRKLSTTVVREGSWAGSGGGRYTRAARTADWTPTETVRFYRALATVGTDFSLMAPLFPDRGRRDLKIKFKKEEKINGAQVDKALRSATSWDVVGLQAEFKEERAEEIRRAAEERKKLIEQKKAEKERLKISREMGMRNSRGAKAMEIQCNRKLEQMTGDYFLKRALEERRNTTKRRKKAAKSPLPPPRQHLRSQGPGFATLSLINDKVPTPPMANGDEQSDMATITRLNNLNSTVPVPPKAPNEINGVPTNIETGSLVVLRVNDPKSPSTTMLQTYISHGNGKLTPVALPPSFLNSVVGYMKKGAKSTISTSSSPLLSPISGASLDSRSTTPGTIQSATSMPSPSKKQRHNSYTIQAL